MQLSSSDLFYCRKSLVKTMHFQCKTFSWYTN